MSRFRTQAAYSGGLLEAKLQPPPLPAQLLARPRLLKILDRNTCPLVLLEAPAGYGKTLLLQQWLEEHQSDYCWLNLDRKDQQTKRLAYYLINALRQLQGIASNFGENTLKFLEAQAPSLDDFERWLPPLIAELNTQLKQPCWLVVDNAHWLDQPETSAWMSCLLANRPAKLQVIFAAQKQPHLQIAQLQLQDQLLILTAQELAFTPLETHQFCQQTQPEMTWREQAHTYQVTQGWPAALKLGERQLAGWIEKEGLSPLPLRNTELVHDGWFLPVWPHPEQPRSQALSIELTHFASLPSQATRDQIASLHQLTWIHCLLGQPKAARGYNREARELAATLEDAQLLAWLDLDLAFVEMHKGHLKLAQQRLACKKLNSNLSNGFQAVRHLLFADLSWYQGKFVSCRKHLIEALLLSGDVHPELFIQGLLLLAALQIQNTETSQAFSTLDEAEQLLLTEKLPRQSWQAAITHLKARLWLLEGKQELALTWLAQLAKQFPATTPARLGVHLAYCHALLLNHKPAQALEKLDALAGIPLGYPAAPASLNFKVQYALTLDANRQKPQALEQLHEALSLAEPDQHRLPFLSLQANLLPLLKVLGEQLDSGSDLQHFVVSLQQLGQQASLRPLLPLIDKLSSREQEVLLLVAEGLSNQEIGQRLFISLHTVKSHLKHLMKKLEVRSRTQAVTRARELRLI